MSEVLMFPDETDEMPLGPAMKKARKEYQERNSRIRPMWEAGESIREIAEVLDLWEETVEGIVRKFETEEALSLRSCRLLENVRKADDLDKKWKASYVIQALRLKTITQNALINHFEREEVPEVSLRGLMDLAISEEKHSKPGYVITHLLNICCIGLEGFWSVVRGLTESDLGERCNGEWSRRMARLRRSSRISGVHQTWSKPCEPPFWLTGPRTTTPLPQTETGTN